MTTIIEKHIARVSKVDDPERRGRIKVTCPGIAGDEFTELPWWIDPVFHWGLFVVPEIGELIDIEVIASHGTDEVPGQSSIDQGRPQWCGARYFDVKSDAPHATPHQDFTSSSYGKRRGFQTSLHTLVFDDTEGAENVTLSWRDKNDALCRLFIDKDGVTVSVNDSGAMLQAKGSDGTAMLTVGTGAVKVAIAEHLAALWTTTAAQQNAFFAAVETFVGALVTGAAGGPAGLVASVTTAGGIFATAAAAIPHPVTPAFDDNIASSNVSIPDNF